MSFREKTKTALKDLIEAQGPEGTVDVIKEALESKELKPENFSIREIWEACEPGKSVEEAVSSDMFPQITGELINARVIEGYNMPGLIGDKLATTVPSRLKNETIVGFDAVDTPEEVQEGGEYLDADIGEKYVTATNTKYGRMISITEEGIYFDRTGQLLNRAMKIGQKAALYREKLIVEGVQDINSNIFKPGGTPAAIFRTAVAYDAAGTKLQINSASSNPFGEAGIEEFLKLTHKMLDENDDPVMINPDNMVLIVPQQLWVEAKQMQNSTLVPEGMENAVNVFKGMFDPVTSYYVTHQSDTTWYVGDFKQDFWWLEVWPLQVMSARPGHEAEFRRDVKSMHKVRFFGTCVAVDYRHVYKFTA